MDGYCEVGGPDEEELVVWAKRGVAPSDRIPVARRPEEPTAEVHICSKSPVDTSSSKVDDTVIARQSLQHFCDFQGFNTDWCRPFEVITYM
jgi:hypothetical protein